MPGLRRTAAPFGFAPATSQVISERRDLDLTRGPAMPPGSQTEK